MIFTKIIFLEYLIIEQLNKTTLMYAHYVTKVAMAWAMTARD